MKGGYAGHMEDMTRVKSRVLKMLRKGGHNWIGKEQGLGHGNGGFHQLGEARGDR